jgi:hypothetical protein
MCGCRTIPSRTQEIPLSPLARQAYIIYEEKLKAKLEQEHLGRAVAVHVDTEDYAIGDSHSSAARALLERHAPDRRIVTLTIGPPTEADLQFAARITT